MTDTLLLLIADYGLSILAVCIYLACLGIPLPGTILLVLAGAFVPGGDIDLVALLLVAFGTAMLGDLSAYAIGSYGGAALEKRLSNAPKRKKQMDRARAFSQKWGGVGVFLSRWLLAPVGPWISYGSGISRFPPVSFVLWGGLGELIWVGGYVTLGLLFSSNALALAGILAQTSWMLLGLIAVFVLGRKLLAAARSA